MGPVIVKEFNIDIDIDIDIPDKLPIHDIVIYKLNAIDINFKLLRL